jgi:hypothetical protein
MKNILRWGKVLGYGRETCNALIDVQTNDVRFYIHNNCGLGKYMWCIIYDPRTMWDWDNELKNKITYISNGSEHFDEVKKQLMQVVDICGYKVIDENLGIYV